MRKSAALQGAAGAQVTTAHAATTRPHYGGRAARWIAKNLVSTQQKAVAGFAVALVLAATVSAALLLTQNITTTPSAKAGDVLFQTGTDYASINAAGFATLTIGSSGTSAALALSGVPGAASTSLGNILKITDSHGSQAYSVVLSRSAALDAAITGFTVTVKNGGTTLATWNAATTGSSASFTLPAATSLDVSIVAIIADGTAVGGLTAFSIQMALTPV